MATVPPRCRRQFCRIKAIGDPAPFLLQLRIAALGQSSPILLLVEHGSFALEG